LLLVGVVVLAVMSTISGANTEYKLAIYTDSINPDDAEVITLIDSKLDNYHITYVDTREEGQELLKQNKVSLYLQLDASTTPESAILYYNSATIAGNLLNSKVSDVKNKYAYTSIVQFLKGYGIKVNQKYFNFLSFKHSTPTALPFVQITFGIQIAACVACVIMFGIAYSTARNNETNISRNLAYLPVGVNRHLISKALPYLVIGILEVLLLLGLGSWLFNIQYQINLFIIIAFSILFIISSIMLGYIFGSVKSQITAVLLDFMFILIPIIIETCTLLNVLPQGMQMILCMIPVIPFMEGLTAMVFNGVIVWDMVIILAVQFVIYYAISYLITRKKAFS